MRIDIHGEDDPQIAISYKIIGRIYEEQMEDYDKAIEYYQAALEVFME